MRLGVLDIGSNTGHLLVVDAHGGAAPLPAYSYKEPLRLAEHLDADGAVTDKGIDALTRFVGDALVVAGDKGCQEILGFATSAVRDASNSHTVLEHVRSRTGVEIEVFGFGSLCIMVEGRCQLSSYVTGASPNRHGVCSPARFVRWEEHADGSRGVRLNGLLMDRYARGEPAAYPTVCKGRFDVGGETFHALEEPTSLNTLELLPRLAQAGVAALKIEGRQRGVAYVASVTRTWREAIWSWRSAPAAWSPRREWQDTLSAHAEGHQTTLGPYHRAWH